MVGLKMESPARICMVNRLAMKRRYGGTDGTYEQLMNQNTTITQTIARRQDASVEILQTYLWRHSTWRTMLSICEEQKLPRTMFILLSITTAIHIPVLSLTSLGYQSLASLLTHVLRCIAHFRLLLYPILHSSLRILWTARSPRSQEIR